MAQATLSVVTTSHAPTGRAGTGHRTVPSAEGGLDLGSGPVTAVCAGIIVVLVAYLQATHRRDLPARGATSGQEELVGVER